MPKYEVSHEGGPAYRMARETPGVHVHADASGECPKPSIGVLLERVGDTDSARIGTIHTTVNASSLHAAEAQAILYGVKVAVPRLRDGEHLFVYTDSKDVVFTLYGKGKARFPDEDVAVYVRKIVEELPSPTEYSLVLCDSDVNPAHEVARGEDSA